MVIHPIGPHLELREPLPKARVVVLGGGHGSSAMLSALLKLRGIEPTVAVTVSDDGGSSGKIREEYGDLPPGDLREVLVTAAGNADSGRVIRQLMSFRFPPGNGGKGGLSGHSLGNLMFTALLKIHKGDYRAALRDMGHLAAIRGGVTVEPITFEKTRLCVRRSDGKVVCGEHKIDEPQDDKPVRILKAWLIREGARKKVMPAQIRPNPYVIEAIMDAHFVFFAPGDFVTSLLPCLLVDGVSEALAKTKATVVQVVNLMTKRGETDGFAVSDFVRTAEEYAGLGTVDVALVNSSHPRSAERLAPYQAEGAEWVGVDAENVPSHVQLLRAPLVTFREKKFRHDPAKLAALVRKLRKDYL